MSRQRNSFSLFEDIEADDVSALFARVVDVKAPLQNDKIQKSSSDDVRSNTGRGGRGRSLKPASGGIEVEQYGNRQNNGGRSGYSQNIRGRGRYNQNNSGRNSYMENYGGRDSYKENYGGRDGSKEIYGGLDTYKQNSGRQNGYNRNNGDDMTYADDNSRGPGRGRGRSSGRGRTGGRVRDRDDRNGRFNGNRSYESENRGLTGNYNSQVEIANQEIEEDGWQRVGRKTIKTVGNRANVDDGNNYVTEEINVDTNAVAVEFDGNWVIEGETIEGVVESHNCEFPVENGNNWEEPEENTPVTTELPKGNETEQEKPDNVVLPTKEELEKADVEKKETERKEAMRKEREEEEKKMTLEEYEKLLAEKRKALESLKSEERKVTLDEDFQSMQLVEKKVDDSLFAQKPEDKLKKKDSLVKDEKVKKWMSINDFLKPVLGGRGRGGRGRGRGGEFRVQRESNHALKIEDHSQFPELDGGLKA